MSYPYTKRPKISAKMALILFFCSISVAWGLDVVFNLKTAHSLYENLLFILSIVASLLFIFITFALFYGGKVHDDVGNLRDKIDLKKLPNDFNGLDFATLGDGLSGFAEGIGGFIIAVLAGLVLLVIGWTILWLSWFFLLFVMAMFYWVFYRAMRLVIRYSPRCRGKVLLSLKYSVGYTFLYISWIYAIVFLLHTLGKM